MAFLLRLGPVYLCCGCASVIGVSGWMLALRGAFSALVYKMMNIQCLWEISAFKVHWQVLIVCVLGLLTCSAHFACTLEIYVRFLDALFSLSPAMLPLFG